MSYSHNEDPTTRSITTSQQVVGLDGIARTASVDERGGLVADETRASIQDVRPGDDSRLQHAIDQERAAAEAAAAENAIPDI